MRGEGERHACVCVWTGCVDGGGAFPKNSLSFHCLWTTTTHSRCPFFVLSLSFPHRWAAGVYDNNYESSRANHGSGPSTASTTRRRPCALAAMGRALRTVFRVSKARAHTPPVPHAPHASGDSADFRHVKVGTSNGLCLPRGTWTPPEKASVQMSERRAKHERLQAMAITLLGERARTASAPSFLSCACARARV